MNQQPIQSATCNVHTSMTMGDPPYGVPYPGTTHYFGPPTARPYGTGDFPGTWIGDFPPAHDPFNPYGPTIVPIPQRLYPSIVPDTNDWYPPPLPTYPYLGMGVFNAINSSPSPWRVTCDNDRIVAAVDMPGVRTGDVNVEIENGTIRVTGKRFDSGLSAVLQQFIGADYDPKTAAAELEAGVLTVMVMRFKDKVSHRVTVTCK